jgi:UDP:flavonoid glycosyltransferase YjiC (YdhE family)
MRVLLAPHGTRGDVQPMLALAHGLAARSHDVAFIVPANFVAWIRSHGFAAESNGVDVEAVLTDPGADLQSMRWQRRHLSSLVARLFESLGRYSGEADVIVGAGIQMAASSLAEQRDVPYANAVFCPCGVPSRATPPPPIKTQTLPRWVNRLLWDVGGPVTSLALRGLLNRGRAGLGLRPLHDVLDHLSGDLVLVAADRDLGPIAEDAPARAVATDAWMLPSDTATADSTLEAFLRLDPPSVYVGFGSMVAAQARELATSVIAAVRATGRAAIVAGGWADLGRHVEAGDDLLIVRSAPHAAVFPRVAAVVHHGGAGTTTAAAAAGVPQVVLPHILDQFYWAHRVAQLGLGPRAMPVDLVTPDILAERLDDALSDPRYRNRAIEIGRAVRARNGVGAAVDHLERLVSASAAPSRRAK